MARSDRPYPETGPARLHQAVGGQFLIEREIGRGGAAIVYLARELRLDRPVAIKVLRAGRAADPTAREHFLREARIAARLAHPNIVPIYRAEEIDDCVFFTMAYVDGETLARRVRRLGALPVQEATVVLQEVAWALAYAHARGVVHRDVKPENILIDHTTHRALVSDFGIAQLPELSTAGREPAVLGTAEYMSPEQASGKVVDARSDIYALGAVAWYTLTGRPLFDGPPERVLQRQIAEQPNSLLIVKPELPASLACAIDRALAKRPADRYPDAESFADAIAFARTQHAEWSAPLQLWLAGGDGVRYVVAALLGAAGLAVARGHVWLQVAACTTAAACAFGFVELAEIRRLLAMGYGLDDLRRALGEFRLRDRASGGRETASRSTSPSGFITRPLGLLVVLGAASLVAERFVSHHQFSAPGVALVLAAILVASTGLLAIARRDPVTAIRVWLWNSPAGGFLAAVARWRLPALDEHTPLAPRSAEASLRFAASQLYESLPIATQGELGSLPSIVLSLESTAAVLRRRVDELTRALALMERGPDRGVARDARAATHRNTAAAEIRAERTAIDSELGRVLRDLGGIRTDLLAVRAATEQVHVLAARIAAFEWTSADATMPGRLVSSEKVSRSAGHAT